MHLKAQEQIHRHIDRFHSTSHTVLGEWRGQTPDKYPTNHIRLRPTHLYLDRLIATSSLFIFICCALHCCASPCVHLSHKDALEVGPQTPAPAAPRFRRRSSKPTNPLPYPTPSTLPHASGEKATAGHGPGVGVGRGREGVACRSHSSCRAQSGFAPRPMAWASRKTLCARRRALRTR